MVLTQRPKALYDGSSMKRNSVILIVLCLPLCLGVACAAAEASTQNRWSRQKAWTWYDDQPWPCGFNYIPANAISYTEMWMPTCFAPKVIDRELALAEDIGFNCLRVVLPFVVWEHDPAAFRERFSQFLEICARHGFKVMPTFFDDCAFGHDEKLKDPWYGKQPEVLEGWYANGWTPSPGHSMVRDATTWPRLERYVKDMLNAFKDDRRVWVWDLYNEPTNGGLGNPSLPLVSKTFQWARQVAPSQPLTIAQWHGNDDLNAIIYANSDIITFHNYNDAKNLEAHIQRLQSHGRPIINTEWLNRGRNSLAESCLPVFKKTNVGCMHWGLVNGKTQTHLAWGWRPGRGEPKVWQHDLFHGDHKAYNADELALFGRAVRSRALLPTSMSSPQTWAYTFKRPHVGWQSNAFNDVGWKEGPGPFGTSDIATRRAKTPWNNAAIWLRKTIDHDATVPFETAALRIHHDEDVQVYLNGQCIYDEIGYLAELRAYDITEALSESIKPGENLLAVKCVQTGGGQYIDLGIDLDPIYPVEKPSELKKAVDRARSLRWPAEKAWQWHRKAGPIVGCNYLPRTAVNDIEMWMAETFDPETIDQELGWAADCGINSVRVFVNYVVYEHDPEGLKRRIDRFLSIAESHNITVMMILLDDCFRQEPTYGKQPDPIPGMHNSQWFASPGEARTAPNFWPQLKTYVQDLVGHFRRDTRILIWDLYNEPKQTHRALLVNAFLWAREMNPIQPVTTCWHASDISDVITFHHYDGPPSDDLLDQMTAERPAICTECIGRTLDNSFDNVLPPFAEYRVGWYMWGLVKGRIQTHQPWGSKRGDADATLWFHDLLHPDGTAYDPEEIQLIKQYVEQYRASGK